MNRAAWEVLAGVVADGAGAELPDGLAAVRGAFAVGAEVGATVGTTAAAELFGGLLGAGVNGGLGVGAGARWGAGGAASGRGAITGGLAIGGSKEDASGFVPMAGAAAEGTGMSADPPPNKPGARAVVAAGLARGVGVATDCGGAGGGLALATGTRGIGALGTGNDVGTKN